MSNQQTITPSTPSMFYAVSWGNQRGVFENYKEAQAAMKGFPSPIWKKFKNREEAEGFISRSKPESTSIEVDDSFTKFFAVARGRVVGIFKDMDTVKKNTKGYPNAMHKKFDTLEDAQHYLEKYLEGKSDGKKSPRKPRTSTSAKPKEEEATKETTDEATDKAKIEKEADGETKEGDESGAKPVARKRTYGTKVKDDKETEMDSSEGHKALREEVAQGEENTDAEMREDDKASGVKEQAKKDIETMDSKATDVNGEQKNVMEDAKMEQEGEEEQQKTATTTEAKKKDSAKKAKTSVTEQTPQK